MTSPRLINASRSTRSEAEARRELMKPKIVSLDAVRPFAISSHASAEARFQREQSLASKHCEWESRVKPPKTWLGILGHVGIGCAIGFGLLMVVL